MSQVWQQPYVNLFKHYGAGEWKKCSKEGDVVKIMDRGIKSSIYRLSGQVPSGNFIQFPHPKSPPLGLTGHVLYVLFKPVTGKYFSIQLDVATSDGVVVRVTLSNMFKEFKSTSTWLQFPVVLNPPPGSVEEATSLLLCSKDRVGAVPYTTRWTLLCFDMQYVLSVYLNKHYLYLKKLRLCSSMFVKNAFTSDICYEPGLDIKVAQKTGLLASGVVPLPREISFPLERHQDWHEKYDYIKFPSNKQQPSYRPEQTGHNCERSTNMKVSPGQLTSSHATSRRTNHHDSSTSKALKSRVALVDKVTSAMMNQSEIMNSNPLASTLTGRNSIPTYEKSQHHKKIRENRKNIVCHLPEVGLNNYSMKLDTTNDVHIYASPKAYRGKENLPLKPPKEIISRQKSRKHTDYQRTMLQPDPILSLKKVVGFGGATYKHAIWLEDGEHVIYSCQSVIILLDITSGKQKFLFGHTNKISALECARNNALLASAQCSEDSIIRIWDSKTLKCLTIFQTNLNNVSLLSFSCNAEKLCAVGEDRNGKQVVTVWDTSIASRGGKVVLIGKAHTELNINNISCMKFTSFDDTRLISCGNHNIRVWKIKSNSLRSCPVDLHHLGNVCFTDFTIAETSRLVEDKTNMSVFFTTNIGSVYEVNYKSLKVVKIYKLFDNKHSDLEKNVSLNTISFSPNFVAVGSNEGVLQLWSTNFKSVLLEAEHDGSLSMVSVSRTGDKVLAGTSSGSLGILDIAQKSYSTITRSHNASISSFSFEMIHNHVATVSEDGSIKLWSQWNMAQVYDFQAENEKPTSVCCHPCKAEFACGFKNGSIRLFSLSTTSLMFELKEHCEEVHSILFNKSGELLYSASRDGTLIMYRTLNFNNDYEVLRCLPNSIARQATISSNAMTLDESGQKLAVIGPSEFVVTVFAARTLDQLLHIDVTTMTSHSKFIIDEAIGVLFSPASIGQLLVVTSNSRLLKFERATGQLLSESSKIHEGGVSSFCCSENGKYIATAGDNCIKVWDYHLEKDVNHQVFIGHCNPISKLQFSSNDEYLLSCGDTLFLWDFLSYENTSLRKNQIAKETDCCSLPCEKLYGSLKPREPPPRPRPQDLDLSVVKIQDDSVNDDEEDVEAFPTSDDEIDFAVERAKDNTVQEITSDDDEITPLVEQPPSTTTHDATTTTMPPGTHHAAPTVHAHFKPRPNTSKLAAKCYAAPAHQAGLKLSSFIGCNGNARSNILWHPETGLFMYTCGCVLIIEDLNSGKQCLLPKHTEEISTLALQNDGQVVATGGSLNVATNYGEICVWNVRHGSCQKVLNVHHCSVIALQFSRDDRYLVSLGNYRECSLVVWCTRDYVVLAQATTKFPMHAVQWHPYSANELVTVGRNRSVLFWRITDDQTEGEKLQMTSGESPADIFRDDSNDVTAVCYADRNLLFTATSKGVVCAWNVHNKRCFMHWQADDEEIDLLVARFGKLVTGSCSKQLCLWSISGIEKMNENDTLRDFEQNGLVLKFKRKLDSAITGGVFDDTIEMGVVGTSNGTIYYISWDDVSDVRIVSGHHQNILDVAFCGGNEKYFATCSSDGGLRLWSLETREQCAQFLVIGQACNCVAFRSLPKDESANTHQNMFNQMLHPTKPHSEHPSQCVAGYQDGTVRMFDFGRMEMLLKMKPHSSSVTAILCSADGRVVLSGSQNGVVVVSSLSTGMTMRVINDHRGASVCCIRRQRSYNSASTSYWLAASGDRRISVWKADWSKDLSELTDWITFAGVNYESQRDVTFPTLADFNPLDADVLLYTGYALAKEVSFYSLSQQKVIKTIGLTDWVLSMDLSPTGNLLAVGCADRLAKLIDIEADTFQDFLCHTNSVNNIRFSCDGRRLLTSAGTELAVWNVLV